MAGPFWGSAILFGNGGGIALAPSGLVHVGPLRRPRSEPASSCVQNSPINNEKGPLEGALFFILVAGARSAPYLQPVEVKIRAV